MKVAVITVQVPFTSGGAEIHAQELRSALIRRGCEAELNRPSVQMVSPRMYPRPDVGGAAG